MNPVARLPRLAAAAGVIAAVIAGLTSTPAAAATPPTVRGLSTHQGAYWGGELITVHGTGFTDVRDVRFGPARAWSVHVVSSSTITVRAPYHPYGTVDVRVLTAAGTTARTAADRFWFVPPTMTTPIQGGLTARQEQRISARVRAAHRNIVTARAGRGWTPAMGLTAMRRAQSWLGLPYSWAGGNGYGPTTGVCAHNGGDLDCYIVGFDCSGLAMYAWSPYRQLAHFAATQHSRAGRFHPGIGELMPGDLVFFAGYVPNGIGHVAVYQGNGMVIQASESGTLVMRTPLRDLIAADGPYRGATRPASTGRQGAVPRVSSVTPQLSISGGYVTITGSQLGAATAVSVGGTLLYSFVRRTATRLVVRAPAHRAGAVTVAVSTAWGTARAGLSYVAPPSVSALSPASGPVDGGNTVTVTGHYLAPVTRVVIGTTSARFVVAGPDRLVITMPRHAAGVVPVTLYSRFGRSVPTAYTFLVPAPPPAPTPSPSSSAPSSSAASSSAASSSAASSSLNPAAGSSSSGSSSGGSSSSTP